MTSKTQNKISEIVADSKPKQTRKTPVVRAFMVSEHEKNSATIIFAKHSIVALRQGANELTDGEMPYVSVKRAPYADAYIETGDVPASVLIENGWNFECCGCGQNIDYGFEDAPIPNWKPADVIGSIKSTFFCCQQCQSAEQERLRIKRDLEDKTLATVEKRLLRKLPGAKVIARTGASRTHAYAHKNKKGRLVIEQIRLAFEFDGMKYGPATLEWSKSNHSDQHIKDSRSKLCFTCSYGDKDAFETFAELQANLTKPKA